MASRLTQSFRRRGPIVGRGANFVDQKIESLMQSVNAYLDKRLGTSGRKPSAA